LCLKPTRALKSAVAPLGFILWMKLWISSGRKTKPTRKLSGKCGVSHPIAINGARPSFA